MKQTFVFGALLLIANFVSVTASADSHVRETMQLDEGWRFKQDDALRGAEVPGFSDGDWETVRVPHTWNRVGYYVTDAAARVNTPATINKAQGVGWYRLSFTPPASFKNRGAWLEFDAASRMASVWLNGVHLGEHKGGFSRFRFDATAALKAGQVNVLAVRTDNTPPAPGSPTADILPYRGDFFIHGGLYRPVRLIATDPVHIDMMDFGGPGVYATTTAIDGRRAEVSVRTKLRNDSKRAVRAVVHARMIDTDDRVVAEQALNVSLGSLQGEAVAQTLMLTNARLWQGVEDPYLYRLQVTVSAPDGRVLDRVEQAFGLRQMRLDPERGFVLNGRPLKLHGVGLHQDLEGKGWAMSEKDIAADVELLREMGANTIRLTHYQHGQTVHELADRHGLIVWGEIPLVSAWTLAPDQKEASPDLIAQARQQLQELIRQNFNHAAVAAWGIANEVDFGNSAPIFLRINPHGEAPDPMSLLRELNALAKTEDPSRPTSIATCCEGVYPDSPPVATMTDAAGANRYFGWYYGEPGDLEQNLTAIRTKRPGQPLSITEYGAGGAISIHTDNPLGGRANAIGREQPEEYMSYVHERTWRVIENQPALWATWLWNAFDFSSTARHEGDAEDINTKGLVTYDRKVKKDAFYFYKANWTTTPTVYITGRRYVDRAYAVTDVRAYSNALATELLLNGQSRGVATECPSRICTWRNVRLAAGSNELIAKGRFASENNVEDRVTWQLAADVLDNVRIDCGSIVGSATSAGRFGSDNFFEGGAVRSTKAQRGPGQEQSKSITGAEHADIAATYREGDFGYRIPLVNGAYVVKLSFVEPTAAAGERRFDVLANSARKLSNFDVAAAAGAPLSAVTRSFPVQVKDGVLELQFKPMKGQAIVSAIEVSRKP